MWLKTISSFNLMKLPLFYTEECAKCLYRCAKLLRHRHERLAAKLNYQTIYYRRLKKKCHTSLHHKHAAHLNFMPFSVVFSLKMSDTLNCSIFNPINLPLLYSLIVVFYLVSLRWGTVKYISIILHFVVGLSYNFNYNHWILCLWGDRRHSGAFNTFLRCCNFVLHSSMLQRKRFLSFE